MPPKLQIYNLANRAGLCSDSLIPAPKSPHKLGLLAPVYPHPGAGAGVMGITYGRASRIRTGGIQEDPDSIRTALPFDAD